jgi:YggT family protein
MNINPFVELIAGILSLYSWVLLIWIVLSWLIYFDVINRYHPFVSRISDVLHRLTEPPLRIIRKHLPDLGGIDISPIILFFLIRFTTSALYTYFYTY